MKLLVATRSEHKMFEIRKILHEVPGLVLLDLEAVGIEPSLAEEDLEPYDSFDENARSKAEYFHQLVGLPTVADDSGLEVDALGGAPGVRSKRFAPSRGLSGQALDDANNQHLLAQLEGVERVNCTARYVCVAVLLGIRGEVPLVCRGEAPGLVIDTPCGSGGFGYDPYIFDPEFGCTFAEMSVDEKNERSHRGKAFRAIGEALGCQAAQKIRDPKKSGPYD